MDKKIKHLPLILNDTNFLSRIRTVLVERPLFLTEHAKLRMKQRKVSLKQVRECVAKGAVEEPAHLTAHGDWAATLGYFYAGELLKVVAAISRDTKGELVVVITVII